MRLRLVVILGVLVVAFLSLGADCHTFDPSSQPMDTCKADCLKIAPRSCSEQECVRGCEFILDRIIERESKNVISCVARTPRRCTDVVWADCAVKVGFHSDGGPPQPPPPSDDEYQ